MFIRLNSRPLGRIRTSAGVAGGIAVVLQLFAAGGLACSTMNMGGDSGAHSHVDATPMPGHAHAMDGTPPTVDSEAPPSDGGTCTMMMHCTAPAFAHAGVSLDVRADGPATDHDRPAVRFTSVPAGTTVPPPRA